MKRGNTPNQFGANSHICWDITVELSDRAVTFNLWSEELTEETVLSDLEYIRDFGQTGGAYLQDLWVKLFG